MTTDTQTGNSEFINAEDIGIYLEAIFEHFDDWEHDHYVCIRGIGEKGTPVENKVKSTFVPPLNTWGTCVIQTIKNLAPEYQEEQFALYIIPAILSDTSGESENVALFTNLLVDIDSGDTDAKLAYLTEHIGTPSMVVRSGGITDTGHPKRHVYYKIKASDDIPKCVRLRGALAAKVGGDHQFGLGVDSNPLGRAHQPIRVGGTCHGKNGVKRPCTVESAPKDAAIWSLDAIELLIHAMPVSPWGCDPKKPVESKQAELSEQKPNPIPAQPFYVGSGDKTSEIASVLENEIHEGGGETNRWSEFNKAAGYFIGQARKGEHTIEEARELSKKWMNDKMVPPWSDSQFQSQFNGLLNVDLKTNGAMPKKVVAPDPVFENEEDEILQFAAHNWVTQPVPSHQYLVDGLIVRGEPHAFISSGGDGKTYSITDGGMKIAAWEPGDNYQWLGQKVVSGGTVVLILCEDSKTELHIRLAALDKEGLIKKAGNKFIVIPMPSIGGAFPLVKYGLGREPEASKNWERMMVLLNKIHKKKPIAMVVIDTLNSVSHGEENSANVIAELMKQAGRVCGELGAALVINHHVRKPKDPVRSLDDLNNAIRGSSAIPSYFRICFGMFHASDYERRMKAMGLRPERGKLFKFGVCKSNLGGMLKGEKTLLRNSIGLLEDATEQDRYAKVNVGEHEAWLVLAVRLAAESGHPYAHTKTGTGGLFKRNGELPIMLQKCASGEFAKMTQDALDREYIISTSAKGSTSKSWLDVPGGSIASEETGAELTRGAYTHPNWDEYQWDEVEKVVVKKSEMRRMSTN